MKFLVSPHISIGGLLGIFTLFTQHTLRTLELWRNEIFAVAIFLIFILVIINELLNYKRVSLVSTALVLCGTGFLAKLEWDIGVQFGWHFNQLMALACVLGIALFLFYFFITGE